VRIVAIADTHGRHADLTLPDGDVLVHAGDVCRRGELAEAVEAIAWLRAQPHATKILVAGNHDICLEGDPEAARARCVPGVIYLEDEETRVDGVRFWGSPWQPWYHDWAFNLERGEPLAAKWALIPEGVDVLITHGPPAGLGDRTASGRQGCEDLRARVARVRPRLHVFGHIHEDAGVWTADGVVSANVSVWGRAATVFDLDPATKAVTVVSAPPAWSYNTHP
jgi:Icc-related predicted phosphoesterase